MKDNLQDWAHRPQRYWYVDGLAEIGGGVVILSLGILFGISGMLADEKLKGLLTGIGQPVLIIGLSLLVRWIVARLKERITYPRTGYVAYRRPEPRRRISGILLAILFAAGIGLLVYISRNWLDLQWLPAITGVFAGLLILIIAMRIRLLRFYLLALFTLAVGIATAWLKLTEPYDSTLFFCGLGLGWIFSGAVTLIRYLRSTTPLNGAGEPG